MTRLLALALVLLPGCAGSCDASSIMAGVRVAQAAPAVGPGYPDGFTVACDAAGDPVKIKGCGSATMIAYECRSPSNAAAVVYVGSSDVAGDGTAGGIYLDAGDRVSGHVHEEYCEAASGTVTLGCRALCASTSSL